MQVQNQIEWKPWMSLEWAALGHSVKYQGFEGYVVEYDDHHFKAIVRDPEMPLAGVVAVLFRTEEVPEDQWDCIGEGAVFDIVVSSPLRGEIRFRRVVSN